MYLKHSGETARQDKVNEDKFQFAIFPFCGRKHERMEPGHCEGSFRYAFGVGGPRSQR